MQGRLGIANLLFGIMLLTNPLLIGSENQRSCPPVGGLSQTVTAFDQAAVSAGADLTVLPSFALHSPTKSLARLVGPALQERACADTLLGSSLPAGQGEAGVYRVYFGSPDRLAELAVDHDIWEVKPEWGYAVMALAATDTVRLRSRGYRLELALEHLSQAPLGPPSYSCYRDVDELYARLQQLRARYPTLTELIDYGDSWLKEQGLSGYDLWILKITNAQVKQPKPRFFLMANIHGRELTTPETALFFADHLLKSYGSDPDVTWIVDYHEVYIIVTANPDSRQMVEDGCYQRKNLNDTAGQCSICDRWGGNHYGVDLNRNNSYRWGGAGTDPCTETYQGTGPASEPETYYLNALVRSIFTDQRPDDDVSPSPSDTSGVLISLHSYGNLVLWPWGWTYSSAPNGNQLQTLGRKFAYLNNYVPEQATYLYPTTGDTTDWAYGELGIPAYTFELGETFFQPCGDLQQILEENLGALLYAAKVPRTPNVTPSGPDALALSVLPGETAAGSPVGLSATIDDTRYKFSHGSEPAQSIASAVYYVDVPPWITTTTPITYPMTAVDGAFDESIEAVEASVDTAGLNGGRHIIYVRGRDAAGHWGALTAVFLNVAKLQAFLPLVVQDR